MRIKQFLFVLWASLFSYAMDASTTDNIHFTHLGLVEGLSHCTILDIVQDQGGNLWFATYDGVNKYDGYNFTVYRHQHTNPHSIASDISNCLAIDDENRIWVGTREGLSLYTPRKDVVSNYYYKNKGFNVAVNSILPLQKDLLMLGTAEGILLFDAQRECFLNDTLPTTLHRMRPTALMKQGDLVYIGTNNGLYTYTLQNGILSKLVDMPANVRIHALLCRMFDQIWMATEGDGLYLYNIQSKTLKNYRYEDKQSGLNSNYVRSLALDTENHLWVGTYGGLNIYKDGIDKFSSLKSSEMQEGSLSQNSVRCIFKDSQGGMWLGTYWGGLNYYHPLCNRFQRIKHIPFLNSLSDNVVSCIVEDKQHNLWIGTSNGGLNFYDDKSQTYKSYLFNSSGLNVPFKDIKTVHVDELHNKVYVGAHAGGMMVLDRRSGHVEYYNRQNSDIPSNNIYSIISDDNNGLWIVSLEYLLHFDINKRSFRIVDKNNDRHEGQQYNRTLFRDSKKRLWIGGEMGIAVFNQTGNSLQRNTDFNISSTLEQVFAHCFYESSSGSIWIGTRNGLFALQEGNDSPVQYTTA
ncbi:MAG: hybrid sensor histidine kinase/response regulator, partial [Bacteroides sp.]|nr:hybrid sensor histidine kinase/response regulator [Bacteroides sp.]